MGLDSQYWDFSAFCSGLGRPFPLLPFPKFLLGKAKQQKKVKLKDYLGTNIDMLT
jgi:hypothetical protein